MSTRLAAEQERTRQAHDRLAEATTGHAAEIELTGRQAQQRIAAAQTERDTAVQAAETARDAALTEAQERGQEAQQAAQRVRSAIWAMTSCEGRAVIRVTGEVDVDRGGMLRGSLDSLLRIVADEDFRGLAANLADVTYRAASVSPAAER